MISGILPHVISRHYSTKKLNEEEIGNVNAAVATANEMIKLAATTDEKLHYVDHPSFHMDNGTVDSSLLSRDGLHLSFKGTRNVVKTIIDKIHSVQASYERHSVIVPSASDDICNQLSENVQQGPYFYSESVKLFPPVKSDTRKETSFKCDSSVTSITQEAKTNPVINKNRFQRNKHKIWITQYHKQDRKTVVKNVVKGRSVNPKHKAEHKLRKDPNRFTLLKHYKCKPVLSASECKNSDKKIKRKLSTKERKKLKGHRENNELDELVEFINTPASSSEKKACNEHIKEQDCQMRTVKQSGGGSISEDNANDSNVQVSDNKDNLLSSGSKVYMNSERELTAIDVIDILRNVDVSKIVDDIDFCPKGNNVFVVGNNKNEDWKVDSYTWQRYGTKKVKVNDQGANLTKIYYKLMNQNSADNRFKKHVFKMEGSENHNLILIQYIGDESIFVPQPHGNNKKSKTPYIRTKPSVRNEIKKHPAKNPVSVMNRINSEINAPCKETGFSNLRNKRQVINTQARLRKQQGLGPDSLYNLHQLFYHLDGYILIQTL